ncbi:hypothetical protein G6F65_021419 [Rhizopus arrhizus]|nr:hypothetical protein G6F65_021419 [Rhizopus arrhizus]
MLDSLGRYGSNTPIGTLSDRLSIGEPAVWYVAGQLEELGLARRQSGTDQSGRSVRVGQRPYGSASHALAGPRPTAHVDHIGGFGAGAGITIAEPPPSANSEHLSKIDHAGFRCGGCLDGRYWALGHSRASLGHHQPPFPRNVAGQRPPGHITGFQLVAFWGEHVPSLEAETGPRAG